MRSLERPRGFTLIVVMVILMVLLILGAAAIKMASSEVSAAAANSRRAVVVACANAARNLMASQLRLNQNLPTTMTAKVVGASSGVDAQPLNLALGHDPSAPTAEASVKDVQFVNSQTCGRGRSPALHPQMTNDIFDPQSESPCIDTIAQCHDVTGRVVEVEFTVHYGLN